MEDRGGRTPYDLYWASLGGGETGGGGCWSRTVATCVAIPANHGGCLLRDRTRCTEQPLPSPSIQQEEMRQRCQRKAFQVGAPRRLVDLSDTS